MVGRVKAWVGRSLGIVAMTVAVGAVLTFSVMGLRPRQDRPADVGVGEVLTHLLRGDAPPQRPPGMEPLDGTFPVLAPPSAAELQANLEKSIAEGARPRGEPLSAGSS